MSVPARRRQPKRVLDLEVDQELETKDYELTLAQQRTAEAKNRFIEIYARNRGMVGKSCEQSGVSYRTYISWRKNDKAFALLLRDVLDMQIDFVESKLIDKIEEGDVRAIMFYLKTKGKSAGYQESIEVSSGDILEHSKHEDHVPKESLESIMASILSRKASIEDTQHEEN